jgi:hypothetical protein
MDPIDVRLLRGDEQVSGLRQATRYGPMRIKTSYVTMLAAALEELGTPDPYVNELAIARMRLAPL